MDSAIFAKRLKLLRLAHKLKSNTLGPLIGSPGKGAISRLENSKNNPGFTPFTGAAEFFAVDLEWLVGRVDEPYREEVIAYEEQKLFPIYANVGNESVQLIPYQDLLSLPEDYVDLNLRKKTYSLALRADIIFLSRYLKYIVEDDPSTLELSEYLPIILNPKSTPKPSLLVSDTAKGRLFLHLDESFYLRCYSLLHYIWYVEKLRPIDQQIPIFDLSISIE